MGTGVKSQSSFRYYVVAAVLAFVQAAFLIVDYTLVFTFAVVGFFFLIGAYLAKEGRGFFMESRTAVSQSYDLLSSEWVDARGCGCILGVTLLVLALLIVSMFGPAVIIIAAPGILSGIFGILAGLEARKAAQQQ